MSNLSQPLTNFPMHFVVPECELVAGLSLQPPRALPEHRTQQLIDSGMDWLRVFAIAEHWEVEPVFFANLTRLELSLPAEIAERVRRDEQKARSRAVAATLWTLDVVRQVEADGIRCIVLKGPALGALAYEDVSFRTFADADLLVAREDLPRASACLQALGYEPLFAAADAELLTRNGHALEFSKGTKKAELHWTLLSRHLCLELPVEELWKSSLVIEVAGHPVRTLDRGSLFVFLCAHGTKHEWERFRWLCDVAQLGERLSESEVAKAKILAGRHHAKRIVRLAVAMAQSITSAGLAKLSDYSDTDISLVASRINGAMIRYESQIDGPPPPAQTDFSSRLGALKYWIGARERMRDRTLVLVRSFLAPIVASGPRAPIEIATRSARLVGLAVRRFTVS